MPVNALRVSNFKGFRDDERVTLKPLTLFIGPNSSGKSSCIHALAALAQTVKLAGDPRPLVLDDEFAQVHLGRFIEVIHSKSYNDSIGLGIEIADVPFFEYSTERRVASNKGDGRAWLQFRSTKTTQDTYLDRAEFAVGSHEFSVKKVGRQYEITHSQSGTKTRAERPAGFSLEWRNLVPESAGITPFRVFNPLVFLERALITELRRVCYLGPFRQSPLRRYPTRGATPTEVGSQGEATITLLANEMVQSRSRTHIKQISRWLSRMGLASDLDVSRVASSDLFDVNVKLADGVKLPIADLGYGLSQVLPVLAQCSFAPPGATLLFEQPELHLHQIAAAPLAEVFIETIGSHGAYIVAETHSPHLFMEIVRQIEKGNVKAEDVVAYSVRREESRTKLREIDIDPDTFDADQTFRDGLDRAVRRRS